MKNYWLVKQEPSAYSWSDFVKDGRTSWTGVRNYTARNNLRAMQVGDEVLYYHSVTDKAVFGLAEVARTAYAGSDGEGRRLERGRSRSDEAPKTAGLAGGNQEKCATEGDDTPAVREVVRATGECGRISRDRPRGGGVSGFALVCRRAGADNLVVTGTAATSFPIFAATAAKYDALVVSVHDVAPATRAISEKIIAELARHGVRVSSLLVVPNYHHRGVSMDDRDFVRWLRDLEADGHEIVIHGYFHQRPRRDRETLRAKMITRNYTSDEGEFYDLSYDEALARITQARAEFTAAGLKPRGFIAPAWLLGKEAERAAKDAEMEYTTRLTTVRDLRTAQTFAARSLVYSVRNSWRRAASLAWNGALARLMSEAPLLRLGLHPPDFEHAEIWRQITRLLDRLAETRQATTYRDWIAEKRSEIRDPKSEMQ